MIDKNSQIRATCGGCLDYDKPKTLVDMYFGPHLCGASDLVIIHRCPLCHKLSKAQYKLYSEGPVASENGYQIEREEVAP